MNKVNNTSINTGNQNLDKLRRVFPQFVKENKIDFDALKKFFQDEEIAAGEEKYGLNWAGKSNAFKLIRTPSVGTLTPQEKESKDWNKTENLFIEGDNLEVLKLLQKHYREKIKMIYIDPPYNTGKDFIYKDNYTENISDYYEKTGQSKNGIKMTTNPESAGRYHSDWLTMMYPRLFLARNLLKEDGVIFISIDDNEIANLRLIMDEIFGEENFVTISTVQSASYVETTDAIKMNEFLMIYKKSKEFNLFGKIKTTESRGTVGNLDQTMPVLEFPAGLRIIDVKDGIYKTTRKLGSSEDIRLVSDEIVVKNGRLDKSIKLKARWRNPKDLKNFFDNNCRPTLNKFKKTIVEVYFKSDRFMPYTVKTSGEKFPSFLTSNNISGVNSKGSEQLQELMGKDYFGFPKHSNFLKYLASFSEVNDIILDFFAGSGTTAQAVMELNTEDEGNRKWICVQLPETTDEQSEAYKAGYKNIAEIARERIRRASKKIGKGDIGFKSLALSKSNYRQWNILTDKDDEEKLKKQMKLFLEKPLVDNYDEKSVVYEILLKEGYNLNSKVTQKKGGNIKYWQVVDEGKKLLVTFEKKITKNQVESLKLIEEDTFVCLDSALDDTTKINIRRNLNVKVI